LLIITLSNKPKTGGGMKKRFFTILMVFGISALFFSCQSQKSGSMLKKSHQMIENALAMFDHPIGTYDPSLTQAYPTPEKPPVTQNLVVIFDRSYSMSDPYVGLAKIKHAQKILMGFNNSLPDVSINCMFKTFSNPEEDNQSVHLVSPMARYHRQKSSQIIDSDVLCPEKSPLAKSLDALKTELSTVKGNIAVIIITDGNTFDNSPIEAAQSLYHEFGPRVGIYPVLVGNSPYGKRLLTQMADQGVCGFVRRSDCMLEKECMHSFIEKILYKPDYRKRDRDKDGVGDRVDYCPTTPEGNVVDSIGCSPDTDGDSISDDRDECPGTPTGTTVEPNGCPPADLDKDGVLDVVDKCLGTPKGTVVNSDGCENPDQDNDGILDSRDACIDTPVGASVDARGCWVISDIQFDPGKWELNLAHKSSLQEVIDIMQQNPNLRIEIQGHTDNIGPEGLNKKLSSYRAMSVMKYLMQNGIRVSRLTFMGYGSEKPIVSNHSPENRSLNRRVEFHPK